MSACGSGLAGVPLGFGPVFGASPAGQGMSVKRDSPVAVLNAMNCWPAGASESKSMISRWKSSGGGALPFPVVNDNATLLTAKLCNGGGELMGSKPRFLSTHWRPAVMTRSPELQYSGG